MGYFRIWVIAAVLVPVGGLAHADERDDLAKKLANPIADLISVPFQYNALFGLGPDGDGTASVLNIEPVIPIHLNADWNLISRTVLPVTYNQGIFADDFGGLADTTQSLFLSPVKPGPGGIIWGVGPAFNLPTATDSRLGTNEWGAGVTAVALVQKGPWTVGTLWNHIWSLGGNDINQTFVEPFATYALGKGRSINFNSKSSYDWNTDQWTVPLTLVYQQVVKFGRLPVQLQFGGTYYVAKRTGAPDWGIRADMTFLFPEGG